MSLFVSSPSLNTLSPMRCWGFQDSTIYQTGEVLGFAYGHVYRFGWQKSSIGLHPNPSATMCHSLAVLLGSWVAAYLKDTTSLALLRPLQEFAQWPSANGRCTSTSFVSVVGCSVLCSWNPRFFWVRQFTYWTPCNQGCHQSMWIRNKRIFLKSWLLFSGLAAARFLDRGCLEQGCNMIPLIICIRRYSHCL